MLRLTLLRHAKSMPVNNLGADIERSLNDRGRQDVPLMGRVCAKNLPSPDIVLASVATRVRETVQLFFEHWPSAQPPIMYDKELYLADRDDMQRCVQAYREGYSHVMICAHQPGIGDFASWLCSEYSHDMPTTAVVSMLFDDGVIGQEKGKLDFQGFPGEYSML